jgi:diguanylate cyclase (GGDEF)-like protein
VATLGVAIVLLSALGWMARERAYRQDRAEALAALQSPANAQALAISTAVDGLKGQVASVLSSGDVDGPDSAMCTGKLALVARIAAKPVSLAVLHRDGSVVCASNPALQSPRVWSAFAGYLLSLTPAGPPVVAPGTRDLLSGEPAVAVAVAMAGTSPPALFAATVPYTSIFGDPSSSIPPGAEYLLLSADRATVYLRVPPGTVRPGDPTGPAGVSRPLPAGTTGVTGVDGVPRLYREATVAGRGWHVLIGMPAERAMATAHSHLRRNGAAGLATVAVVVALGFLLFRALVRPVRRLRATIEAAGTDSTARARAEGPAEIAALAEAFNATAAQRQQLEAQLSHQALHDPLTGLPNRALLSDRLANALARQARTGECVAVCFLDLDRFKIVNDGRGHPAGDTLLVSLAARLTAAVRPSDTVARFGGDEFVIIIDGVNDARAVLERAQDLIDAMAQPFVLDGEAVHLSGTVGVAVSTGRETGDDLIRNADAAMYAAKGKERGSCALYDEGMHTTALSRLETERDLRRALESRELVNHYQPKCSLATGRIVGAEALVRWSHPQRGLVLPADFIPVAEEIGLIVPVGDWVLTRACFQLAAWRRDGRGSLGISVNLSRRQLSSPGFPERVAQIIAEAGIDAADVTLELTESSLLGDAGAVADRLAAVRAIGIKVSIDDFGTGYSSLAYLRALPVDEIKIDRSFINDLPHDKGAQAVVASIVHLGHALGLTVVAEGVESQAQLDQVRKLGCDLAQGFHLSPPLPADALNRLRLSKAQLAPAPTA